MLTLDRTLNCTVVIQKMTRLVWHNLLVNIMSLKFFRCCAMVEEGFGRVNKARIFFLSACHVIYLKSFIEFHGSIWWYKQSDWWLTKQ